MGSIFQIRFRTDWRNPCSRLGCESDEWKL